MPNAAREHARPGGDEQRLRLRRQQRLRDPAEGGGLSAGPARRHHRSRGPLRRRGLARQACTPRSARERAALKAVELFSARQGIGCHQAGEIRPFEPRDYLGERNLRPIDRTSRLLAGGGAAGPGSGRLDGGAAGRAGDRAGPRHHLLQRPHDRRVRSPRPAARALLRQPARLRQQRHQRRRGAGGHLVRPARR